jgi:3-phosphoshikimate 1-carboxyvinyltransferase
MNPAQFQLPSSKSESHRVLALLYLSKIDLNGLVNPSNSRDTQLFIRNLRSKEIYIDFHDAGTPARIALALFAFEGKKITLTGNKSLQKRSIKPLVDVLNNLGADIIYQEREGFFPCTIHGQIKAELLHDNANIQLDRSESSQFATAMMLICSQMHNLQKIQISLFGKEHSNSYIEMTVNTLNQFQIPCTFNQNKNLIEIQPNQPQFPTKIFVEADWSAALYGFQYFLACRWTKNKESDLFIPQLKLPSLQGDSQTLPIFEKLGLEIEIQETGILCKFNKSQLQLNTFEQSFNIDCRNFPDAVPTLVSTFALACFLKVGNFNECNIVFEGISNLITKESNRIEALNDNLKTFGFELAKINEENYQLLRKDNTETYPSTQETLTIKTFQDHRIAMCFAPWKMVFPQLKFDDIACVEKSFPDFWNQINP